MSGKKKNEAGGARGFAKLLAKSAHFANYSLRSQFCVRRLRELSFLTVADEVRKLLPLKDSFKWTRHESFGIDKVALKSVVASGIEPLVFFLHPRVLSEQPSLLLYYRCVAMISQKGLARLVGGSVAAIEGGKAKTIDQELQTRLVVTVNRLLSLVATSFVELQELKESHLDAFLFAQAGSQIQGSWNNAVGEQGERAIREMLVRHLHNELVQVVWKDDSSVDLDKISAAELLAHAGTIKVLRMKKGFHCAFGSEPDVSLRNADDMPLLSVEVKAGSDPAGALERYGAAIKSFEHEKGLNPRLKTVYVAACITEEVRRRLSQDNPFSHTFLLGELLADARKQKRFANLFVDQMLRS